MNLGEKWRRWLASSLVFLAIFAFFASIITFGQSFTPSVFFSVPLWLISFVTSLLIAIGFLELSDYLSGFQTRRQKVVMLSLSVIFHLGVLEASLAFRQAGGNSWVNFFMGIWQWIGIPIMTGLVFVGRSVLYRNRLLREGTSISEFHTSGAGKTQCPHCGREISSGHIAFPFWEFRSIDRLEPIPNSMQCPYCSYLIPADSTIKSYPVADMNKLAELSGSEKKRFTTQMPLWIPVTLGLVALVLSYLYGYFTYEVIFLVIPSLVGILTGLWVGICIGRSGNAFHVLAVLKKPALYKSFRFPFWDLAAVPLLLTILWMTDEFPLLIFIVWSLASLVFTIAFYARNRM